jgi:predicted dehydrogenase
LPADIGLITVDPAHFHAALLQKTMLPGISRRTHVYAPLGPDLVAHLHRIAGFNTRAENPSNWELEIHAGPDFFERMLEDRAGDIVILSGRNRRKIEWINSSVKAGYHVLADKPWILDSSQLGLLETALDEAERTGVMAYDGMTERFEISSILQRELVNDPAVFGACLEGSPASPAVFMDSVHHLMKLVAGVPNLRPASFFDVTEQGEGLTDVGTHLVDTVHWTLYPEQVIDHRGIQVISGERWPTILNIAEFRRVTGESGFPNYLAGAVKDNRLEYFCNNRVVYRIGGIHVRLDVKWDFEPGAGDTQISVFRGSRSTLEVRQGAEEHYRSELYVVPNRAQDKPDILAAVRLNLLALEAAYPGVAAEETGERIHVAIPNRHRIGHEAHFASLVSRFLEYVRNPDSLPAWEKSHMLAKYYVTTKGVELAHSQEKRAMETA